MLPEILNAVGNDSPYFYGLTIFRYYVGVRGIASLEFYDPKFFIQLFDSKFTIDHGNYNIAVMTAECPIYDKQITVVNAKFPH